MQKYCIPLGAPGITVSPALGEAQGLKPPPWPGSTVTICMSCFTTEGPGKEQGTNKPPPTRRVRERSKGDTTCPTTSQNPSLQRPSWLNKTCTTRKGSESEGWAKDTPETNPITIKPETLSHGAELFSWVPLPSCSPPRRPFPIKLLAFSARVFPQTIHSRVLVKSPVSGPGRGPPSCNTKIHILVWEGTNLSLWHCQCHFYLAEYCYFWVQVGHPEMCWTFLL